MTKLTINVIINILLIGQFASLVWTVFDKNRRCQGRIEVRIWLRRRQNGHLFFEMSLEGKSASVICSFGDSEKKLIQSKTKQNTIYLSHSPDGFGGGGIGNWLEARKDGQCPEWCQSFDVITQFVHSEHRWQTNRVNHWLIGPLDRYFEQLISFCLRESKLSISPLWSSMTPKRARAYLSSCNKAINMAVVWISSLQRSHSSTSKKGFHLRG